MPDSDGGGDDDSSDKDLDGRVAASVASALRDPGTLGALVAALRAANVGEPPSTPAPRFPPRANSPGGSTGTVAERVQAASTRLDGELRNLALQKAQVKAAAGRLNALLEAATSGAAAEASLTAEQEQSVRELLSVAHGLAADASPLADGEGSGKSRDGGVTSYGDYRWPTHRILRGLEECDVFSRDELTEIVPGFGKASQSEAYELMYWYAICGKLCDILKAHSVGDIRLDAATLVTITACSAQAEERIGYLLAVCSSNTEDSGFSKAYWQTLAKHRLDDRHAPRLRGALAEDHQVTQVALRAARAKATANAENARTTRGKRDHG